MEVDICTCSCCSFNQFLFPLRSSFPRLFVVCVCLCDVCVRMCWLVDSWALGVCKSFCVTWDNVCGRVGCQTLQAKYKRFEMLKTLLNLKQRYIENISFPFITTFAKTALIFCLKLPTEVYPRTWLLPSSSSSSSSSLVLLFLVLWCCLGTLLPLLLLAQQPTQFNIILAVALPFCHLSAALATCNTERVARVRW